MDQLERISHWLVKNYTVSLSLLFIVLVAGLTINLGMMPFDSDEPTRMIVALEMILSGNYWVPTINDGFYYNKPPVFNWLIILSWKLWGEISEFSSRFPTVVSTIGYTISIYFISRRELPKKYALLHAFMFLTCGRILFYDSFLGLIDVTFSWLLYLMFMLIYYGYSWKNKYLYYTSVYALCSITFLMKGLPSVVFVGTAIISNLLIHRKFKQLFSWQHIAGGLTFFLIVGGYYFIYSGYNDLGDAFMKLFTETSKRTVVRFGIGATLLHLLTFPFEMVYHFLPWSLFIGLLLNKKAVTAIRANRFESYAALTFLLAIVPYWTSPEVFPRYLHMLSPFIFFLYTAAVYRAEQDRSKFLHAIKGLFIILAILVTVGIWAVPFVELLSVPYLYLKVSVVFLLSALALLVMWKQSHVKLLAFGALLIILRLGFSWFIIPSREKTSETVPVRGGLIEVGQRMKGQQLFIFNEAPEKIKSEKSKLIGHFETFYLTRERDDKIPMSKVEDVPLNGCLIVPIGVDLPSNFETIDSLTMKWGHTKRLIIQKRDEK